MHRILKSVCAGFILLFVLLSLIACNNIEDVVNVDETESFIHYGKKNIECLYYNTNDFLGIKDFEQKKDIGTIQGCIVPHHLLASDLIHDVLQNVKKDNYKTVILIGPDHESIDKGKIFTTLNDWQAPTGILKTDDILTNKLLEEDFVLQNDDKLTLEHSTSSIIPFIKYYLSDVKVVTLVLTKQTKLEHIDRLVEILCENVSMNETLFISAVDFSHYLDLDTSNKMDDISMKAIENKDISKIMSFTNDNLDSPVSIVMMLKLMDKLDVLNHKVLNHSNSELISKKVMEETTSYMTYLFY